MVTIRLARRGANKRPFYSIVVSDRRRAPGGACIERIGFFNPLATSQEPRLQVDRARVDYWLKQGAKPSDRVASLLKRHSSAA
ncbi:MAG: 30S ribosomal protein S16 [Acidiferrobacteraceae bacterium]